jgi:hypothetical protein
MEKPLTDKQFNKKVRQRIIYGVVGVTLIALTLFVRWLFTSDKPSDTSNQNTTIKNSDSSTSATVNNKDVKIGEDQITAGRDAIVDKRKIDVKGDAFFDSSKQIINYQGLKQRHIDLTLMKKILDSIPSKETNIEILAGGGKEGENLAKEIADYLEKKGYKKANIMSWSLTGNWDITEYHYDKADNTFRIDIHPQANDKQVH